jgi:hypothetical protein
MSGAKASPVEMVAPEMIPIVNPSEDKVTVVKRSRCRMQGSR